VCVCVCACVCVCVCVCVCMPARFSPGAGHTCSSLRGGGKLSRTCRSSEPHTAYTAASLWPDPSMACSAEVLWGKALSIDEWNRCMGC
jgi:hypothetical protein